MTFEQRLQRATDLIRMARAVATDENDEVFASNVERLDTIARALADAHEEVFWVQDALDAETRKAPAMTNDEREEFERLKEVTT